MADEIPLSPEEEAICECVSANRADLRRLLQDFTIAVQLFDYLERGDRPFGLPPLGGMFVQYRVIAAKEGALNIYHFGCSLSALREQIRQCPRTRDIVDALKVKEAFRFFSKHFPHANNIRHGVAHAGEIWASPAKAKEHKQEQDYWWKHGLIGVGSLLYTALHYKTYYVGWKAKIFEVNMDQNTIHKLTYVVSLVDEAFQSISAEP